MSLDSNIIKSENSVPIHPFQVVDEDSPKGAFEEKQIETDYHVRIDMPGVSESGLTITQDPEKGQIRFCGKVPSFEEWPECVRAYASVINLNTTKLDDIQFQYTLVNGSLSFVFRNTQGSLQILKYRGGKTVDQSEDHLIIGNLESTNRKGRVSRLSTLGEITLTQEKCEINPLMIGSTRSCFVKKCVNDGGPAHVLHILVDTPGMEEFIFDISTKVCIIHGALEEQDKGDYLKSQRSYFISMKFDCRCCKFDLKGTKKTHQVLKDGLLRLQLRILSYVREHRLKVN